VLLVTSACSVVGKRRRGFVISITFKGDLYHRDLRVSRPESPRSLVELQENKAISPPEYGVPAEVAVLRFWPSSLQFHLNSDVQPPLAGLANLPSAIGDCTRTSSHRQPLKSRKDVLR
jgi:hypothetical protein